MTSNFNGFVLFLLLLFTPSYSLQRGGVTDVSITFVDEFDIQLDRFSLDVIADDFSRIRISNAYTTIDGKSMFNSTQNVNCTADDHIGNEIFYDSYYISSEGFDSVYKKSYSKSVCIESKQSTELNKVFEWQEIFFPISTVIIEVDEGNVKRIFFDDGCFSCGVSSLKCERNAIPFVGDIVNKNVLLGQSKGGLGFDCGITLSECQENPEICDLVVYLVWQGVDSSGDLLESYSKRISNFIQYNVEQLNNFISF